MDEADGVSVEDAHEIEWRRLPEGVWVGRRDDRSIGTIERSAGWVWVDAGGRPHGRAPSLCAAQDAARRGAPVVLESAAARHRQAWISLAVLWLSAGFVVAIAWVGGILLQRV